MEETFTFADLLRLIDERSNAFVAAVAAAPSLDVPVPTCPEWTLFDLVQHLGVGRRAWAATIAAGPADAKAAPDEATAPPDREALLAWMAASTKQLVDALTAAGPDRGCWTWWGDSQSPETSGAAARHQLQEIAMHTYDAQLAAGLPAALVDEIAYDGVDEFLFTCNATKSPWPHEPAVMNYHVTDGRSWRLEFNSDGLQVTRITAPDTDADLSVTASAADLELSMYGRIPVDQLKLDGDRRVLDQLVEWEP
ncbi:maleylpyruvate isomerase N-terminal domain-containing protein [Kutzneria chonburiensis]|uniref:Maleylpyruvate isomerase N-terminal domain-containing protein n=1 Tax=Kutzneria chonburiensis TaxID=1483604 RepID=A0ABV6MRR4_9PSEU|nr:maleylpyruvate isomerase N-terminal domain-containing protein [Kutzneria chonburiensis]